MTASATGPRYLDCGPYLLAGCSGTVVSCWTDYVSALDAAKFYNRRGCGNPACTKQHRVRIQPDLATTRTEPLT